jgi:hypothetical protein
VITLTEDPCFGPGEPATPYSWLTLFCWQLHSMVQLTSFDTPQKSPNCDPQGSTSKRALQNGSPELGRSPDRLESQLVIRQCW